MSAARGRVAPGGAGGHVQPGDDGTRRDRLPPSQSGLRGSARSSAAARAWSSLRRVASSPRASRTPTATRAGASIASLLAGQADPVRGRAARTSADVGLERDGLIVRDAAGVRACRNRVPYPERSWIGTRSSAATFPTGRRGYDSAAVDEHLRRVADAFESNTPPPAPSLAATTSDQVRQILEAAERSVADVRPAPARRRPTTSPASRPRRRACCPSSTTSSPSSAASSTRAARLRRTPQPGPRPSSRPRSPPATRFRHPSPSRPRRSRPRSRPARRSLQRRLARRTSRPRRRRRGRRAPDRAQHGAQRARSREETAAVSGGALRAADLARAARRRLRAGGSMNELLRARRAQTPRG